jgi:hypothetical protein
LTELQFSKRIDRTATLPAAPDREDVPVIDTAFDRSDLDANLTDAALFTDRFPHQVFTALRRHEPARWTSSLRPQPGNDGHCKAPNRSPARSPELA